MFPYWLLFGFFALGGLTGQARLGPSDPFRSPIFAAGCVAVMVMVGFRLEIGNDWFAYVRSFEQMSRTGLDHIVTLRDPGYKLLDWAVAAVDGPYWLVTLIGAAIFARGLYSFSRTQPEPWLAALVAIPYMTIVVAMGYNRQGIALGFLLIGLAGIVEGRSYGRFLAFAGIAALFHSSAVIAIPLTIFGASRSRLAQFAIAPALVWYLYSFALHDDVEIFVRNYVETAMQSEGAAIRLALCAVPAVMFFMFRRRFAFVPEEEPMWRNFSLAAIALTILYFFIPSSTAIDRVALYVMPLQLAVFSRVPLLVGDRTTGRALVILLSLAIQFVWLNYAAHARQWIPYKMGVPFAGSQGQWPGGRGADRRDPSRP